MTEKKAWREMGLSSKYRDVRIIIIISSIIIIITVLLIEVQL